MKKLKSLGKKLDKTEQKKLNGGGYGGACLVAGEPCGLGTPPCCVGTRCAASEGNPWGDHYCFWINGGGGL